jgi:preprotein translocase subunit SecA
MIYKYRYRFLKAGDLEQQINKFINFEINRILDLYFNEFNKNINYEELQAQIKSVFFMDIDLIDCYNKKDILDKIEPLVLERAQAMFVRFSDQLSPFVLSIIDQMWQKHLYILDCLRQNIGLRSYAQKDPLNEYQREGFELFKNLISEFRLCVVQGWLSGVLGISENIINKINKTKN